MVGLRSFGNILGDFSHTLFVLNGMKKQIFEYTKSISCWCDWADDRYIGIEAVTSAFLTHISRRGPAGTNFCMGKSPVLQVCPEVVQTVKHLTPMS